MKGRRMEGRKGGKQSRKGREGKNVGEEGRKKER